MQNTYSLNHEYSTPIKSIRLRQADIDEGKNFISLPAGSSFNPTGLYIYAFNSFDQQVGLNPISYQDLTFSGYDMSTPGWYDLTVSYRNENDQVIYCEGAKLHVFGDST